MNLKKNFKYKQMIYYFDFELEARNFFTIISQLLILFNKMTCTLLAKSIQIHGSLQQRKNCVSGI